MGTGIDVILAALLGVLVGVVASMAFTLSERERRTKAPSQPTELSEDEMSLVAVLPETTIILDSENAVVRADPEALHVGIVRAHSVVNEDVIALVERLRATGETAPTNLEIKRGQADGAGYFYLTVTLAPLTGRRVLVVVHDRTAEIRLEQTRRDFVQNISHELKTPVGAIGLLAETVAECADDPVVVARFAEKMKVESARLATLVQDIIDLSRLQEPDALRNPKLVRIDRVVAEAVDRVSVNAAARSIELRTGGEQGVLVRGKRGLLVTAVRNLLDNAIRYSDDHTTVSLGVSTRNGMAYIAVVDRGDGIPERAQKRVFERFYRTDAGRSRETGGSGLGLSIVKHIAADHGGEVTLWSEPGRGATFTLAIPLAAPQEDESEQPAEGA